MRFKKAEQANSPEVLAVNKLSNSVNKLQNICSIVWNVLHTTNNALSMSKHLDELSDAMHEVQERIDDVKELHSVNARQRTLDLTKTFRAEHGFPERTSSRRRRLV